MTARIDEHGCLIVGNCALPAAVVPAVEAFYREQFSGASVVPEEPEVEKLRGQIEEARSAWWSATEQGDNGLIYTDRVEGAMDETWSAIGHADWTPASPLEGQDMNQTTNEGEGTRP
jgi:hypothetical protein